MARQTLVVPSRRVAVPYFAQEHVRREKILEDERTRMGDLEKSPALHDMPRDRAMKHFREQISMPREAPVTQGPDELGPRNELRARILSMRLFPNLYNKHFLENC